MEDGESKGLRQALEEGAGEIGESAAADLPETLGEVRAALPDTVEAAVNGTHSDDLSLDTLLDGTPLDDVVNTGTTDGECGADD